MSAWRFSRLCVLLLCGLLPVAPAAAGRADVPAVTAGRYVSGFPDFQVQLQDDGSFVVVLGTNSFTPGQLLELLGALPQFIEESAGLAPGGRLALRQAGVAGYLAVTASNSGSGVEYVLTLQAEPPAGIAGAAALQGLGLELASVVLTME